MDMLLPERDIALEAIFPFLTDGDGYKITSPQTTRYNCIAWAANDDMRPWWPDSNFIGHWPKGVPRECTIQAFISAYQTLGYAVCEIHEYEEGFEKIAIFVDASNTPTHAARQLDDRCWTSKLGKNFDVSHALNGVCNQLYGTPKVFMRRLNTDSQQN